MPGQDIIVVGASAGGVEALSRLVEELPPDLAAAVFVVLHISPSGTSVLPNILARRGQMPVAHAEDGEPIQNGRIYVAPPDHHLLVAPKLVRVGRGPREHGNRPAADTLFRSAAASYGPRVVGVVLSGTLDDGTAGLVAIKARGGMAIIQDPDDALYPGMPRSALAQDHPDLVLPVAEIGRALVRLSNGTLDPGASISSVPQEAAVSDELGAELSWSVPDLELSPPLEPPFGEPSGFTCPECHGALWEIADGDLVRFRCRVGHGYGAESLISEQARGVEAALWAAVRALEERAALNHRLAIRARERDHPHTAAHFEARAADAEKRAEEVRYVLRSGDAVSEAGEATPPPGGNMP